MARELVKVVKLVWETPFDVSMLSLKQGVVIHCPNEHLAEELFEIFKENNVGENWVCQEFSPNWDKHEKETAYFVKNRTLLYGPKAHAEQSGYSYTGYMKCTFYGIDTPDFDVASNDELRALFGIGGG